MYRKGREGAGDSKGNTEAELVSFLYARAPENIIEKNTFGLVLTSNRRLNKSPATLEEKEVLKKFLTTPPVKKIDLHFPLGLEVTARNLKGVTIKDALDAIHKQFKKKVS